MPPPAVKMAATRCVRIRLKPGTLGRVREWAAELSRRKAEALETLREEGVLMESVFLEHATDGDFLVYYMRAADFERSFRIARASTHPIDAYHRAFKEETWASSEPLELLLDLENIERTRT